MTGQPLIAHSPWRDDDGMWAMVARAVAATGTLAGRTARVVPEPLMREEGGVPVQSIRVLWDSLGSTPADLPSIDAVRAGDEDLLVAGVAGPEGSTRLLVRRVSEPTAVRIEAGGDAIPFELRPQRDWSIHLVHHSHFDFGYTDPQTDVFQAQRSYLDSVLELARATDDWPDDARFRWNAEALWAFSDWERSRPQAHVDEFIRRVGEGRIDLSAMPFNLHTDVCSTEELHELLVEARRIRDRYGVDFPTAMQTDVPGQVVGLPDALAEVGVRYLSVAHNWAGRSVPHLNGGIDMPRLFRWRTPAGNEVVVWRTDSPHGGAYMEGPMVGFADGFDAVDTWFPAYLEAVATRGYPYSTARIGGHGEDVEPAEPYPFDVLHLRTQGRHGDNAPARLRVSEIVREWNDTWTSPKLRVSTNHDFFTEVEERWGEELQTFEGDWGDWWVEGVGSAAASMSVSRDAQRTLPDGRATSELVAWSGGAAVRNAEGKARTAYEALALFDEHTWGAGNSWEHSDRGFESGERQWQWKSAQALIAGQNGDALLEEALVTAADAVGPASGALASIVVAEQTASARTGIARAFLKESVLPIDAPFRIVDARDGSEVPFAVEGQQNPTHRESARWLRFLVADAPSFGLLRFDVVEADARGHGMQDSGSETASGALSRMDPLVIRNEFLEVRVDATTSTIASIRDLRTGRELVHPDPVVGFNGYVYDRYASAPGFNHLANRLATSGRLEMIASRGVARPAVVLEHTADAIEQRIVYESAAPGATSIVTTLRLRVGEPLLHIENRLAKERTWDKESAYFAFPFAVTDPTVRYEVSGGVTGDDLPHLPSAPQHMRAVRHWVSIADATGDAVWVTRDAPLVEPETIALPYAPFPDSTAPRQPGTIYSWAHNNLWDTNFPIEQGFEMTFSYAVGVPLPDEPIEAAAIRTTSALTRPLRGVLAAGAADATPATRLGEALLELSDPRVQVISVVGDPDRPRESVLRLQSMTSEPVDLVLTFADAPASAERTTLLGDSLGALAVDGRTVSLALAPLETVGVRIARP